MTDQNGGHLLSQSKICVVCSKDLDQDAAMQVRKALHVLSLNQTDLDHTSWTS